MTTSSYLKAIAASGARWVPTQVGSGTLIGWYEVRPDLVTLGSGTDVAVLANRVPGGANPLVQPLSGSSQRPAYEATGWNGRPSILFDGLTNYMHAHGLAASVTGTDTPFTIVLAAQLVTVGTVAGYNRAVWCFGRAGNDSPLCGFTILDGTPDGAMSRRDDANTLRQRAQASALTTSRATYTHKFTGTHVAERTNSVLDANLNGVASPAAEVDVGLLTLDTFSVGCAVRATTAWLSNVRLGGMLVYAGALDDADILLAEKYLKQGHPL